MAPWGEAVYRWLIVPLLTIVCGCTEPSQAISAFEHGDYQTALRLWQLQAKQGDPIAQNYLGILCYLGLGVPRDYSEAAKWYRLAAIKGNADAQRNLGTMHLSGLGVPQDNLQAYAWFYAAAKQGNTRAQHYLDSMTEKLTPNQIIKAKAMAQPYTGVEAFLDGAFR